LVLLDDEERARILELIEAETWPQKWSGDDLRGDALVDLVVGEGLIQPILSGLTI
jgi:DNA sulfur modification protein DndC